MFNAIAPIKPEITAPKNIPKILARLPSKGIGIVKIGIVINPFSIVSLSTIAPIPLVPAMTILPASINRTPSDLLLFSGLLK